MTDHDENDCARTIQARLRALQAEMQKTLERGYSDVALDFAQLRAVFADVVKNLNEVLGELPNPGFGAQDADPFAGDARSSAGDATAVLESVKVREIASQLITTLQFEDIASQIFDRTRRRLLLLEMFTAEMLFGATVHKTCAAVSDPDSGSIRQLQEDIRKHHALLREVLERVRQHSLDHGDVVLF